MSFMAVFSPIPFTPGMLYRVAHQTHHFDDTARLDAELGDAFRVAGPLSLRS